jgi:DNA anti-recombination protein RmuC
MNQKDFDLSKIENLASDLNSRGTKIIDNFSSLKQNLELLSTNLQSRLDSLQSTASSIASELEQFDKTQNSATTSFTPNQSNSAVKGMESSSTILHPNAMSSNLSGEAILDGDLTEDDQYQQMLNHLSSAD